MVIFNKYGIEKAPTYSDTNKIYRFNNANILPLYWFGENIVSSNGWSSYYEENNKGSTQNLGDRIKFEWNCTTNKRACVSGVVTSNKINVAGYTKLKVLYESATFYPSANEASTLGNIGNGSGDWNDENRKTGVSSNISTNLGMLSTYNLYTTSGSYYIGLQSWGVTGNVVIRAMWLE